MSFVIFNNVKGTYFKDIAEYCEYFINDTLKRNKNKYIYVVFKCTFISRKLFYINKNWNSMCNKIKNKGKKILTLCRSFEGTDEEKNAY